MGFSLDYSSDLIPEGEYEVVITAAFEDMTKRGAMFIGVPMVIRNDVDQPQQNRVIRHQIWQRKEPEKADIACGGYMASGINRLSKAAGLPAKNYTGIDEWLADLKHKPVRITVAHEEWNCGIQARVGRIDASSFPDCKHQFKDAATAPAAAKPADDKNDGDLPF